MIELRDVSVQFFKQQLKQLQKELRENAELKRELYELRRHAGLGDDNSRGGPNEPNS